MEAETVQCERHGARQPTFVCDHLLDGSGKGWVTIERYGRDRPDAVCEVCDAAWRDAGDEWTDEVAARVQIRVVCAGCYDELRDKHRVA